MPGQTEYVQPIALLRAGSHEDAVRAVALASVNAYVKTSDDPTWAPWLNAQFAKSVRRCKKTGPFTAVEPQAAAKAVAGEAQALAFLPTTYDAMDPRVRGFQVEGTELPRLGWATPDTAQALHPLVVVNESPLADDKPMSTGKTAAQAAHGLFAWYLRLDADNRQTWVDHGQPFSLLGLSGAAFTTHAQNARVIIRDAGHTEVPSNTLTVAVI